MKNIYLVVGLVVTLFFGYLLFTSPSKESTKTNITENSVTLSDAHGISVDRSDPSKIYIATHSGLISMNETGYLQYVGAEKDDYMGFSPHPTEPNTFYTSGHPRSGGNLGFQKTTDGGQTWKKISDGAGGPVDFHTMAVGLSDPSTIYGVYRGQLQRSLDEGKNWEVLANSPANIITLATNNISKDSVYAGTTDGIYISQDKGQAWSKLGSLGGAVSAITVNPNSVKELVAYSGQQGLISSIDGGVTWAALSGYKGVMVMHLTSSPQNASRLYLINQSLEIHQSSDRGATWKKLR